MRQFTVNGIERNISLDEGSCLNQLLLHIRENYVNDSSLITSIRIDGLELKENDEQEYSDVPISAFDLVEIFTSHPREIAEETLQLMLDFTIHLENCCQAAAETIANPELRAQNGGSLPEMIALIDGVSTFIESLLNAKTILRIDGQGPSQVARQLAVLEADLLDILKETTEYFEKGEWSHVETLLKEHLPRNLTEWREKGIPSVIRSRDS